MSYEKELKELHMMQQIYSTIFSLANKIQVEGDKYFGEITVRQFMTMLAVLHLPEGEASLNRIAEKTGTTKQNINSMIITLVKKGFVKTEPSQTDKRAVNVTLTQAGEEIMAVSGEKGIFFMAELFLSFSMEELELLRSLLKKLYPSDQQIHSGFEAEASLKHIKIHDSHQVQLLETFKQFRKKRRNEI